MRIWPPLLFTIFGASKDMDEISVSGRYGITSEETYNTLLSFIKSLLLCTMCKTHKITKIYADLVSIS